MLSLQSPAEIALHLARRVKERRLERGWTQRELADRAGLSAPTYILFERTGRIALLRLIRVLEVLGLVSQVDQLANRSDFSDRTLDEIAAPKRQRGRPRRAQP